MPDSPNCKRNASEVEEAGKKKKTGMKNSCFPCNRMIMTLSVPAMPVTGLSKSWMKFNILYQKNRRNL